MSNVHPLATHVVVYVDGVSEPDFATGGLTEVDVTLGAALGVNAEVYATQIIGGFEGAESNTLIVDFPICLQDYGDDFNVNSSAAWNVIIYDGGGEDDAAATFAYDYSADGVPPSPNGGGSTLGLKFEVNQGGAAAVASVTASPIGLSYLASTGYRLTFDMWINANGPFPAGGAGSTEFLSAGVGYDDSTPNMGNVSGSGGWFSISGEGGSSRDIRPYKDDAEQFPASGQYASESDSANNTNFDPYYVDVFGTPAPPEDQTSLDPTNQTGSLLPGSAGFAWHEVTISVFGNTARWEINGIPIVTLDTTIGSPFSGLDGNISVGMMDVFSSIAGFPEWNFGLVDNVKIYVPHTPGADGDWDGDLDVDLDDFNAFEDCAEGPGLLADPGSGIGCASTCEMVFDVDLDGDLDMIDFADLQVLFTGP